jgi:hypothetical protein
MSANTSELLILTLNLALEKHLNEPIHPSNEWLYIIQLLRHLVQLSNQIKH